MCACWRLSCLFLRQSVSGLGEAQLLRGSESGGKTWKSCLCWTVVEEMLKLSPSQTKLLSDSSSLLLNGPLFFFTSNCFKMNTSWLLWTDTVGGFTLQKHHDTVSFINCAKLMLIDYFLSPEATLGPFLIFNAVAEKKFTTNLAHWSAGRRMLEKNEHIMTEYHPPNAPFNIKLTLYVKTFFEIISFNIISCTSSSWCF